MGELKPLSNFADVSRRSFVITGSTFVGAMALGVMAPGAARAEAPKLKSRYWADDAIDPEEVNAWVVIGSDEAVTLRCPMAEMGQGTGSGLPMLLAEELQCDWSKVTVEFASVNRNLNAGTPYGNMLTVGSMGIRMNWEHVQQAGALLVCRSPDVGCRAGEDLLHLGWRRGGTAVAVTVGLDHVGGGAGDEGGRLAGAAKGLGRKR